MVQLFMFFWFCFFKKANEVNFWLSSVTALLGCAYLILVTQPWQRETALMRRLEWQILLSFSPPPFCCLSFEFLISCQSSSDQLSFIQTPPRAMLPLQLHNEAASACCLMCLKSQRRLRCRSEGSPQAKSFPDLPVSNPRSGFAFCQGFHSSFCPSDQSCGTAGEVSAQQRGEKKNNQTCLQ